MRLIRITRAAAAATVLVYAALVIHGFYRTVDHAVYLAVDDGLANIAYALGTEGRYGFLTSPTLVGLSRANGQFNYGPWFFYVAAGLVWLFGYSLTLLRSIHLWVIVALVATASWWFGRRPAALWALFAFGALFAFAQHEWPMFRPDSFVSLFAVGFVVSAGYAIRTGSDAAWFGAGLSAACGALTHLIAWTLLPASAAVWALAMFAAETRPPRSVWIRSGAALAGGAVLAFVMFYASFGFRFGDQLRFLRAYREITGASSAQNDLNTSFVSLLSTHFHNAYGEFAAGVATGVRATAAAAWALVLGSLWFRGAARAAVRQYVAPPIIAWTFYLVSLGWYTNLHAGYAILNHVLAAWCAVAVLVVIFDVLNAAAPRIAASGAIAVNVVLAGVGVWLIGSGTAVAGTRIERTASWVSIRAYVDAVLDPLPHSPTAWGSLVFGIENPGRIRMLQFFDAVSLTAPLPPEARVKLAPQFILWGYPENFANALAALDGQPQPFARVDEYFPDQRYQLVSMVAANPYGVTRVYQQGSSDVADDRLPLVSVYDAGQSQWSHALEELHDATFVSAPPQRVDLVYGGRHARTATQTLRADLPAGVYLLRVRFGQTPRPSSGVMVVSSSRDVQEAVSELGPASDFSPYGRNDTETFLVHRHIGGALSVSQLDDASPPISEVSAFSVPRVSNLSPSATSSRPVPGWRPVGGARSVDGDNGPIVEGDETQYGYQMISDLIAVRPRTMVTLHAELAVERGRVCVGVLDRAQQRWIVTANQAQSDYRFDTGSSDGFYVLVANCNAAAHGNDRSRFKMTSSHYAVPDTSPYSDRFFEVQRP
jgi:hypothetical protein